MNNEVDKDRPYKQWDRLQIDVINFISEVMEEYMVQECNVRYNSPNYILFVEEMPNIMKNAVEIVRNRWNIPDNRYNTPKN